jgi:hypothetical protein
MGWELWATLMDAHQTWQMLELSISSCYKGTGALRCGKLVCAGSYPKACRIGRVGEWSWRFVTRYA